jgi:DNA polymerase I-like protein with 3'-5' exonuclease and polymerase domains
MLKHRGTITGRFSSSEPNIAEVVPGTVEGRRIREIFEEQVEMPASDYSAIEDRIKNWIKGDDR